VLGEFHRRNFAPLQSLPLLECGELVWLSVWLLVWLGV
jgi:hypothetical protein